MEKKTLVFTTGPHVSQREEDCGVQIRNTSSAWQEQKHLPGPPPLCPGGRHGAQEDAHGCWSQEQAGFETVLCTVHPASDTGGSVHLGCPVKGSRVRDIMGRLRKSSSRGQDSQLTNYSV